MILERGVHQNEVVRRAVIDVGSNSLLLTVMDRDSGGQWTLVHEETAVTALGEGVRGTGLLAEPGMAATLHALASMFRTSRELGVTPDARGTMALRIAENSSDFLARAAAQGTPVVVLSGQDEAALGFECVANDPLFARYPWLAIVDPGGHSTELTVAKRDDDGSWDRVYLQSFAVGTLGLKSQTMPSESPGPMEILATTQILDELLAPIRRADIPNSVEVVVLGATGTNLISIRERLAVWEPDKVHGAYLSFEEISRAVGWLMPLSDRERQTIVGMEKGRERTLHIGALILERFLWALQVEGCFVSVQGWRYALLER